MSWPLVESGLWISAGIADGGLAMAGPMLVATGEATWASGLAAFLAGAALAAFAWRRTQALLGDAANAPVAVDAEAVDRLPQPFARPATR